ncbi:hypothetical protein SAE01_19950 [Segetibacter aerophilus]|uniref:Uncharacterized protein n=1 Tax=Segetibacter aerophilus TaxID=670293 RepID=A0A512BBZ3_9BACT|nr:hypothetical protein SAE01_19950 [Segetibacter aerophilus]
MARHLNSVDFETKNWKNLYNLLTKHQEGEIVSEVEPPGLFVRYIEARPFTSLAVELFNDEDRFLYRLKFTSNILPSTSYFPWQSFRL